MKDVLEALTDTTDGNRYSRDLRDKDEGLKTRWAEITRTLGFRSGGGMQDTTLPKLVSPGQNAERKKISSLKPVEPKYTSV